MQWHWNHEPSSTVSATAMAWSCRRRTQSGQSHPHPKRTCWIYTSRHVTISFGDPLDSLDSFRLLTAAGFFRDTSEKLADCDVDVPSLEHVIGQWPTRFESWLPEGTEEVTILWEWVKTMVLQWSNPKNVARMVVVVGCEFDAFVNAKLFGIDPCHIHLLSRPQEVSTSEDDLEPRQTTTRKSQKSAPANKKKLKLYNRNDFQVRTNQGKS